MSKFTEKTIARFKENADENIAARNEQKATAIIEAQISVLKSEKVDAAFKVTEAEEWLETAIYPTSPIIDNKGYTNHIKSRQEAVNGHRQHLENIEDSIKYFEALLESFK